MEGKSSPMASETDLHIGIGKANAISADEAQGSNPYTEGLSLPPLLSFPFSLTLTLFLSLPPLLPLSLPLFTQIQKSCFYGNLQLWFAFFLDFLGYLGPICSKVRVGLSKTDLSISCSSVMLSNELALRAYVYT